MKTPLNQLRLGILETFPKTESPDINDLIVDESADALEIRSSLLGIPWWLVKDETIRRNFENLPLLTPNAYHYYLPAFIISSVQHFEPDNLILVHTVFSLAPFKTPIDDSRFKARRDLFTPAEVRIIVQFLNCVLSDERMYSLYNDAERGLRKFWA